MHADHRTRWPAGDGQVAALIREAGWSTTPLGPTDSWPQSLRIAVEIALATRIPVAIFCGPRQRMLYNDAFASVLGERHPGALGEAAATVWPDLWGRLGPRVQRVLEDGRPCRFEDADLLVEPDQGGTQARCLDGCLRRLDDATGSGIAVMAVLDETTEQTHARRQHERLLAQAAGTCERLRQMFDQAPALMVVLEGPQHRFAMTNAMYRQFMGGRPLSGRSVREALPELEGQGYLELLDEVYRTGKPHVANDAPVRLQRAPGEAPAEVWLDFLYQPLTDARGEATGIFCLGVDVTERHRAVAALRASEERYRLLVESAKDYAIVGMDAAGRITSWNTGAERLMGYRDAEAIGQSSALCFTPEDRAVGLPERELATARENGRAEHEGWHQRKDGSRFWGSGLVVPQENDPRRGLLKIFRDRTAEQLAHREREARVAALHDADRRKDEFLATLAHELRNPLAPLRNVASLLKRSGPSAAQLPLLEIMDRQVGQLRRLVEDLLEVSRITQGKIVLKREPMRVSGAVYAALEAIQPLVDRRRQVLEARVSSSAVIDVDSARITQVITNLLNNASKFTAEGGRIALDAFDEADAVLVRVRDEGIGIAPEMLPRVFELFVQGAATTTDQAQGGLGIGLSLVKRLVELHGGTVRAHSDGPGRGACFTVRLPRGDAPAPHG